VLSRYIPRYEVFKHTYKTADTHMHAHVCVHMSNVYSAMARLQWEKESGQVTVHRCLRVTKRGRTRGERERERSDVSKTCFYQFCRGLRYFSDVCLDVVKVGHLSLLLGTKNPVLNTALFSRNEIQRNENPANLRSNKITYIFSRLGKKYKVSSKNGELIYKKL